MIRAIPNFHFHLQASRITTPPPPTNHTIRTSYGSRLVRRSSNPTAANDVVRKFYDGINRRDLPSVEDIIAPNCIYEDFIFSQPLVGRKAILDYFKKLIYSMGTDLEFAIDDISEEDSTAIGVIWHCEWKGKRVPFTRGCSFYRLEIVNGHTQILLGRDAVEPVMKPGEAALGAVRGVTWLLQNFPFLADRL